MSSTLAYLPARRCARHRCAARGRRALSAAGRCADSHLRPEVVEPAPRRGEAEADEAGRLLAPCCCEALPQRRRGPKLIWVRLTWGGDPRPFPPGTPLPSRACFQQHNSTQSHSRSPRRYTVSRSRPSGMQYPVFSACCRLREEEGGPDEGQHSMQHDSTRW